MPSQARVMDLLLHWKSLQQAGRLTPPEELCRDCPELLDDLRRLIQQQRTGLGDPATGLPSTRIVPPPVVPEGPAPATAGRYHVLRDLGEGGLGVVKVARDEEVRREVALKRIKPRYVHDSDCRRRFLLEAELTGQLEHPGVVPVYGLGLDADGCPYYAMRLVRGETLADAVRRFHAAEGPGRDPGERALAFRQLLSRFVAVCNTVAYAHSKHVLHRDLKPANIMLGPFGETLVLDWGLARSGEPAGDTGTSEAAADLTRGPAGTPAYMSPEQAHGDWASVGPASDVFSLGATLYHLLTGRPPYQGRHTAEVLDLARRAAFPPPRQVKATVPKPLDAVCRKAMAPQPQDRYASALDLAADVEHWLAEEPVSAWPEPWALRVRRWARRHRSVVTAAVVGVLVALVGSAVALVLVNRARLETRAQRDQAEKNFQLALENNTAVVDLADELGQATTTQRRSVEKVLRVADEKYKRLLESAPGSESAVEGRARVLNALAGIYLDLGDLGRSHDSAAEAVELYTKLAKQHPEAARLQAGLALGHERLGCVRGRRGDSKGALDDFRKALAIRQRLAEDGVADPDLQEGLARCHFRVGNVLLLWGDVSGAKAAFQEGFTLRERLARQEPKNGRRQRSLALAWGKLGAVRWQEGDQVGAATAYRTMLSLLERAAKDDPGHTDWLLLAEAHMEVGNVLWEEKRTRPALEQYEAARQIAEPLARLDPENLECLRVSLYARLQGRERTGGAADPAADRRERLAEYQSFLDVVRRRAEKEPADTMLQGWLALHHRKIGLLLAQQGKKDEAIASLRKAVAIDETLTRQAPDDEGRMIGLHLSYFLLASVQGDQKKLREMQLVGERAVVAFHQRRAESDPKKAEWQRAYAVRRQRLGEMLYVMNRHAEAAAELRKAIETFERLPERPAWQNELAACHNSLANALAGQGDHKREIEEHRKSLALHKRLAEKHPDNVAYQRGLVYTSQQLVSALRIQGNLKEALAAFAASRPARARLLKVKLADLAAWSPPTAQVFGVAAIGALHAPGRVQRQRQYLAGREQLWGLTGRLDRTIDVTEAIVELVEALDLADPAGAAEARQLLTRARDIYRRLNNEGQLIPEEKELIPEFDRAVKGLTAEPKPAPAAPPARELATLRDHKVSVRGVAYLAGGKLLATLGDDGTLILRDPATGAARTTFAIPGKGLTCVNITPDGATLAVGFRDGTVKILDVATKKEQAAWKAHPGPVAYLTYSPDGKTLATARQTDQKGAGEVKLWDASGKAGTALSGGVGLVNMLAFSPDGKVLAAGGGRAAGEAWLWDVATGKQRQPLKGHDYNVTAVAFAPDSKMLATASQDGTVRLWDVAAGRGLGVLPGHTGWVLSVAFTPDGKVLASSGLDGTVRLWAVSSKQQRGKLRGHTGWVYGVAFAPDGKRLATVSGDPLVPAAPGELKLWRLAGE